jgi:hypothetical protein
VIRGGASAALLLLAPLCLTACDDTPGQWSLFVYADAHDRSKWVRTDRFKTERVCRRAGEESISALPEPRKAAYRCVKTGPPG